MIQRVRLKLMLELDLGRIENTSSGSHGDTFTEQPVDGGKISFICVCFILLRLPQHASPRHP